MGNRIEITHPYTVYRYCKPITGKIKMIKTMKPKKPKPKPKY